MNLLNHGSNNSVVNQGFEGFLEHTLKNIPLNLDILHHCTDATVNHFKGEQEIITNTWSNITSIITP